MFRSATAQQVVVLGPNACVQDASGEIACTLLIDSVTNDTGGGVLTIFASGPCIFGALTACVIPGGGIYEEIRYGIEG